MYSVYGDESADETKARVVAVSGVFGSEEDWNDLKAAWLERTGGRVFHATECETNQGEFANTSNMENKALYKDLTQLLCKSRLMGKSHAIDLAAWRSHSPDALEDMPYLMCFRNVVYECGALARVSIPQDRVEFTFDQHPETEYNTGVLYKFMAEMKAWNASSYLSDKVSFATRKGVGIQVADLLAREAMKHLDNIVGPILRPTRLSMRAILDTKRFQFTYLMEEYFVSFKEQLPQLAKQFGVDYGDYVQWLDKKGQAHNISNLHRYMIEKWPPESEHIATA